MTNQRDSVRINRSLICYCSGIYTQDSDDPDMISMGEYRDGQFFGKRTLYDIE